MFCPHCQAEHDEHDMARCEVHLLRRILAQLKLLVDSTWLTKFTITALPMEKTMANLQIFDDGKGVKFTAVPDKPLKTGEVPVWSSSDSSVLIVTADPSDPTGLTALGTFPNPPKDGSGIVATISLTRLDGVVISDPAAPVDVVPDPNGEPGSFVITETAQ